METNVNLSLNQLNMVIDLLRYEWSDFTKASMEQRQKKLPIGFVNDETTKTYLDKLDLARDELLNLLLTKRRELL